jgi:1-pyrroline-5-carboxylate dehydrogenase
LFFFRKRADIFLHAADLCAGKYRMKLNAATMLGQAKNVLQAEIGSRIVQFKDQPIPFSCSDSACELVDFLRFNAYFALKLEQYEPISTKVYKDSMIHRGLEVKRKHLLIVDSENLVGK